MHNSFYLDKFHKAADQLDKKLLNKKQLEIAVVKYGDSVVLKLYKKSWAGSFQEPLTAESRIFFSVWINESAMQEQKLWYNIHALKLRKLKGYSIQSRKFADSFRKLFRDFSHEWENVSTQFGPLTLMEGWIKTDSENLQVRVLKLANRFLQLDHLIDQTLGQFVSSKK